MSVSEKRSVEEHLACFIAYATRVARLTPEAWERLSERCAPLSTPSFGSLLRRVVVAARPNRLWIPGTVPQVPTLRAIAAVSDAVQTTFAFVIEVMREFDASSAAAPPPPWRRTTSTGNPRVDAYGDALYLIESTLTPYERTQPGLVTAARAAGQAVMRHDWLSAEEFTLSYGVMESEIPYAELDASSDHGSR